MSKKAPCGPWGCVWLQSSKNPRKITTGSYEASNCSYGHICSILFKNTLTTRGWEKLESRLIQREVLCLGLERQLAREAIQIHILFKLMIQSWQAASQSISTVTFHAIHLWFQQLPFQSELRTPFTRKYYISILYNAIIVNWVTYRY